MRRKKLRVGFQGEFGAYSEVAAELIGEPIPFPTFERVFDAVLNGEVDCAAIPIANAVAGVVKENAELLWRNQTRVKILAETTIPISHCLIGLRGSSIRSASEVHSHWQALAQCQKFFQRHKRLKPIEAYDTAGSAKLLAESGDGARLVIASERAAERYGLRVLKRGISDVKWNKTRFFFIAPKRASLALTKKQETTVLVAKSLADIAALAPSLVRIDAIPTRQRAFETHYLVEASGEAKAKGAISLGTFGRAR